MPPRPPHIPKHRNIVETVIPRRVIPSNRKHMPILLIRNHLPPIARKIVPPLVFRVQEDHLVLLTIVVVDTAAVVVSPTSGGDAEEEGLDRAEIGDHAGFEVVAVALLEGVALIVRQLHHDRIRLPVEEDGQLHLPIVALLSVLGVVLTKRVHLVRLRLHFRLHNPLDLPMHLRKVNDLTI